MTEKLDGNNADLLLIRRIVFRQISVYMPSWAPEKWIVHTSMAYSGAEEAIEKSYFRLYFLCKHKDQVERKSVFFSTFRWTRTKTRNYDLKPLNHNFSRRVQERINPNNNHKIGILKTCPLKTLTLKTSIQFSTWINASLTSIKYLATNTATK